MSFYVVKGSAGACGDDCDSWIAAEGRIDNQAAARFRKFLKLIGDRHLPIYFNSPGGNLDQGLAIGNILRTKNAMARVGRTVVQECGFEPQDGAVCVKRKQSGRDLTGDVWTRGAICNSACPYMILGAPTREIAPDALLAVHSPRVIMNFTGGVPTPEMRHEALDRAMTRSDNMVSAYLKRMGAEQGLLAAARAVKFESFHILTREEIATFAIDRRAKVESDWAFEHFGRGLVYKTLVERVGDGASFRTSRLQIFCLDTNRFELQFLRDAVPSGTVWPSVSLALGTNNRSFLYPPRQDHGQQIWAIRMNTDDVATLSSAQDVAISQKDTLSGRDSVRTDHFSSDGLRTRLLKLTADCPAASYVAQRPPTGSVPAAGQTSPAR